mmetsp:Transcript_10610/g.17820  ORF Transcript_10610/g.17820 Transcript_10610/m.17820 type:complete len:81 (+) Transcript_10610:516-758(+)
MVTAKKNNQYKWLNYVLGFFTFGLVVYFMRLMRSGGQESKLTSGKKRTSTGRRGNFGSSFGSKGAFSSGGRGSGGPRGRR